MSTDKWKWQSSKAAIMKD